MPDGHYFQTHLFCYISYTIKQNYDRFIIDVLSFDPSIQKRNHIYYLKFVMISFPSVHKVHFHFNCMSTVGVHDYVR